MAFIRHPKDFYAGLLFIAFGIAAIVIGSNYALGTAARMGPGYFPRILGILLVTLGAILALRATAAARDAGAGLQMAAAAGRAGQRRAVRIHCRPGRATVFDHHPHRRRERGEPEFRWKEALVSGVFFALLAIAVFVLGLKLQLPILPPLLFGPH